MRRAASLPAGTPPAAASSGASCRFPRSPTLRTQRRTAAKPQRPCTCRWQQSCEGRWQGLASTQCAPPTCQALDIKATLVFLQQWRLLPLLLLRRRPEQAMLLLCHNLPPACRRGGAVEANSLSGSATGLKTSGISLTSTKSTQRAHMGSGTSRTSRSSLPLLLVGIAVQQRQVGHVRTGRVQPIGHPRRSSRLQCAQEWSRPGMHVGT